MSRDLPVKPHFAFLCSLGLRVRIRVRVKKLKARDNLKASDLVKAGTMI